MIKIAKTKSLKNIKRCRSDLKYDLKIKWLLAARIILLLENLYEWERMTVADALQEVTFDENEIVVKEGDDGDDFFIILDG